MAFEPKTPNNIMVVYVGPKKQMYVPFPIDNVLPLRSMSELDELVVFKKKEPVELSPERAEALLLRSPDVFKQWGTIKPKPSKVAPRSVTTLTLKESEDVEGSESSILEAE